MKNNVKILLVDDQTDFLDPISYWLQAKGYQVMLANSGQQAIKLIKSTTPDIIFLDIKMPEMDGIQTLDHIRKFDRQTPIIMLTAYGDEENLAKACQLGISGFFPKKAELVQLANIIETTLRTHKKIRSK
jgi:CheY-like chemotaxis protein